MGISAEKELSLSKIYKPIKDVNTKENMIGNETAEEIKHRQFALQTKTGATSKTQYHYNKNNAIYFLVPLLVIILKETSALPPIIKIGE